MKETTNMKTLHKHPGSSSHSRKNALPNNRLTPLTPGKHVTSRVKSRGRKEDAHAEQTPDVDSGDYEDPFFSLRIPTAALFKSHSKFRKPPVPAVTKKPFVQPLLRFKRAVRTVMVLLKATSSGATRRQHRPVSKLLSFAQYQDELLKSQQSVYGAGLTFDPVLYKAQRETHMSQEAKAVLCTEQKERTEEQQHIALVALHQAVDAFAEFPINMQRSLVRVGWYEHFEAKRVIIRQGHVADNFYFILSGTAVVTILETDNKKGESYVRTAAFLGRGNSFGELALMHGATRSATVTCQDDVELLALGREDFVDIFMHVEKNVEPEHIQYLRQIDLLQGWPLHRLPWNDTKICLITYFRRGNVMCRDSNKSEWLYVIKSGSCRVLKSLHSARPDIKGLQHQEYSHDITSGGPLYSMSRANRLMTSSGGSSLDVSSSTEHAQISPRQRQSLQYSRGLPPIRQRSDEELMECQEQHQQKLEEVYKEKHDKKKHHKSRNFGQPKEDTPRAETVFVQVQTLGPKDTFGFEAIAFSLMENCTSVSLVSDGAEAVLINKKFFMQHLTDEMSKKLRTTIQPYPSEESLQQKLQDQTNWAAFKTMTVNDHIIYNKFVNDTLDL